MTGDEGVMIPSVRKLLLALDLGLMAALPASAAIAVEGVAQRYLQINDFVTVRTTGNLVRTDIEKLLGPGETEATLEFSNLGSFVDVRPFRNNFVISGGVYTGDKRLDGTALPGRHTGGPRDVTAEQAGALQLSVSGRRFAPFVGIGYDTTFDRDRRWGLKLMAGAMLSGTPQVTLAARDGALSDDAILKAQLEQERRRARGDTGMFDAHPVVQAGLTFRF